jgi:hypothetical protein
MLGGICVCDLSTRVVQAATNLEQYAIRIGVPAALLRAHIRREVAMRTQRDPLAALRAYYDEYQTCSVCGEDELKTDFKNGRECKYCEKRRKHGEYLARKARKSNVVVDLDERRLKLGLVRARKAVAA